MASAPRANSSLKDSETYNISRNIEKNNRLAFHIFNRFVFPGLLIRYPDILVIVTRSGDY